MKRISLLGGTLLLTAILTRAWLWPRARPVKITYDDHPPEGWRSLTAYQLIYSLAGLALGVICVVGGIVLFFHGVLGSTGWVGGFIGAQSKLSDAAPGTVLFVIGLFVVWVTRFDVQLIGGSARASRSRGRKPALKASAKSTSQISPPDSTDS